MAKLAACTPANSILPLWVLHSQGAQRELSMLRWQKDCSLFFLKELQRWKWISASRTRSSLHCMPIHQKCFIRCICQKRGAEIIHIWLLSDCFCYLFKVLRLLLRLIVLPHFVQHVTVFLDCVLEVQQKQKTADLQMVYTLWYWGCLITYLAKWVEDYNQLSFKQISFSVTTMQMELSVKHCQMWQFEKQCWFSKTSIDAKVRATKGLIWNFRFPVDGQTCRELNIFALILSHALWEASRVVGKACSRK